MTAKIERSPALLSVEWELLTKKIMRAIDYELRRQRIPASMNSSISPFNTADVFPVS